MATKEGTSLEQLFRTYAQIYNKDHTSELAASAANLIEYTDLTEEQIVSMNLTCAEIDKLTEEARYMYSERATILKQIEIAKKMRDIQKNKATEKQGFTVESMLSAARDFDNYFDTITTRYNNFKYCLELQLELSVEEKNLVIDIHNLSRGTSMFYDHLMSLETNGKIENGDAQKLYILSVDWPQNVMVDHFKWQL